jgi:hypothetical protein
VSPVWPPLYVVGPLWGGGMADIFYAKVLQRSGDWFTSLEADNKGGCHIGSPLAVGLLRRPVRAESTTRR